jgi:hypothetical protein
MKSRESQASPWRDPNSPQRKRQKRWMKLERMIYEFLEQHSRRCGNPFFLTRHLTGTLADHLLDNWLPEGPELGGKK